MRKISKTGLAITIFIFIMMPARAQDYTYSQFYANPLYLNPALAGSEFCSRFSLNYRNQWPSLPGSFVAYSAGYDRYSDFFSGGFGLLVNYDKQGEAAINHLKVSAMYAYRLRVSRDVEASFALQAGYGQRGVNWNDFILPSGLNGGTNPLPPEFSETVTYPDFAGGLLVGYDERYFFGGAVHHITQPDIGFFENQQHNLDMKITLHAGASFGEDDRFGRSYRPSLIVSPNVLYQQQAGFRHLNAGSYFALSPMVLGVWFRHAFENSDAVVILLGLQHENYRIGYSYDYTVSQLSNATGGAHEISFAWVLECQKKSKRPRAIKCPSF
jgi:type IX secretion system PorP/SprF family membrane protein